MSLDSPTRAMRVIVVEGLPGGERIIEGKAPTLCIHRRPLVGLEYVRDSPDGRVSLCRLCDYEAPRFDRRNE